MRKLLSTYLRIFEGFRKELVICIAALGLAGILEGTALLVLIPILGQGISSARHEVSQRYISFYNYLHIPRNHRLTYAFCLFILIGFISSGIRLLADSLMAHLRAHLEESLRKRTGAAFLKLDWPYYLTTRIGEIDKTMLLEMTQIGDGCYAFMYLFGQSITAIVFIGISFYISTTLTFISFFFGACASIAYLWGGHRASRHSQLLSEGGSKIANRISEIFSSLKFIRASGKTDLARTETHLYFAEYANSQFKSMVYRSINRFLFEIIGIALIAGFLAYGFFWSGKPIEWSIVFLTVFYRLTPRLQAIQDNFYSVRVQSTWLRTWLDRYADISHHPIYTFGHHIIPSFVKLTFESVSYQFPKSQTKVIDGFNLSLLQGKCVALVGVSGAGKSTILDLTTGILRPKEGKIFINNISIEDIMIEDWRSHIGLVLQNSPLYYGTVLENIAWGDAHPNIEKATECAKIANAWTFIQEFPHGILTSIEERGGRLSGGQRQRIALARALYNDPWLIILDEPTSELDNESEERILLALKSIQNKYAILMVSHRLKLVTIADEILLLDHGKVIQRGGWEQLISTPDSPFCQLAQKQQMLS